MKKPSQEDLLGYVLGAMDAQEQRNIEEVIDRNPQVEDDLLEIKNSLLPLDHLDGGGPRPGLARRTCELIATLERDGEIPPVTSKPLAQSATCLLYTSPSPRDRG